VKITVYIRGSKPVEFVGDEVVYACDGDGELHVYCQRAEAARTALFARGEWARVVGASEGGAAWRIALAKYRSEYE